MQTVEPSIGRGTSRRNLRRRNLWLILGAPAAALAAFVVNESHSGPGARIRNPHPQATHIVNGDPRAQPAFLGFGHFLQFLAIGSLVATAVVVAAVVRRSWREGRWTPTLTLIVATTSLMVIDPFANWATYTVFNPREVHLPEGWAWGSVSPSIEPLVSFVIYWWWFLAPAWITLALYRRISQRQPGASVFNRRPVLSLLVLGFLVCVVFDTTTEITCIRFGCYTYNQVIGSLSYRAGTTFQFPWYESILFPIVMAPTAALMWRDKTGRSWPERTAERATVARRWPNAAPAAAAFMVLFALYVGYIGAFTAIRFSHSAKTLARPFPFQDMKVYDPQGTWQRAHQPGPFYRGVLSNP